jgi:hypothetical protein
MAEFYYWNYITLFIWVCQIMNDSNDTRFMVGKV